MSFLRALWLALLLIGVATSASEAQTGLRVVGDSGFRGAAEARIASWLTSHGHEVTEKALGQLALAALDECYLRVEPACASKSFTDNSDADLFIYVNFEVSTNAKGEQTVVGTLWLLRKQGEAQVFQKDCNRCDDEAAAAMIDGLMTRVGSFNAKAGTLKLTSSPSGVAVLIDGKSIGKTPLEHELKEGDHELVLRRDGYLEEKRTVTIETGGIAEQAIQLRRKGSSGMRRLATYGAAATAVALIGGGIVALALHEGEPCSPSKKECRVTKPAGIAAFAGAGVMLGVAGYLWFTNEDDDPIPTTALQPRVRTYVMGWGGSF